MAKNVSVFGLYNTQAALESAVETLQARGFRTTDISVLFPRNVGNKDLAVLKSSKAPEGISAGGASGAFVGGTLGWLAGVGMIAVPGVGPLIAAGPMIAALAGLGAGAALGGLAGAIIGFGLPEYEARRYDGRVRHGAFLISVHCDDKQWVSKAYETLKYTGAQNLAYSNEAKADYLTTDRPVHRAAEPSLSR